jgi:hypothetical protein
MHRPTVYLITSQKAALAHIAKVSGRSEAELIREGVDLVTSRHTPRELRLPLFASDQPTLAEHVDEALRAFGDQR